MSLDEIKTELESIEPDAAAPVAPAQATTPAPSTLPAVKADPPASRSPSENRVEPNVAKAPTETPRTAQGRKRLMQMRAKIASLKEKRDALIQKHGKGDRSRVFNSSAKRSIAAYDDEIADWERQIKTEAESSDYLITPKPRPR
jgi:type IV secretory pathway VirB10-like protein